MISEGSTSVITCKAVGYPPPTVVWNRMNGILSVSVSDSVSTLIGDGNITRVSVNLTIANASREDTGVYTCSANNSIGSDDRNVNITVQRKCNLTSLNIKLHIHLIICFVLQIFQ